MARARAVPGESESASATVGPTTSVFGYDADGLLTRSGDVTMARDAAAGRVTGTALGAVTTAFAFGGFGLGIKFTWGENGASISRDAGAGLGGGVKVDPFAAVRKDGLSIDLVSEVMIEAGYAGGFGFEGNAGVQSEDWSIASCRGSAGLHAKFGNYYA
jgi:hypothetical protein